MEKMKSIAGELDVFFRVLQALCLAAAIAAGVGLLLIAACFLFDLDPDLIGRGYHELDVGFLELCLSEGFYPDQKKVLLIAAAGMFMGCAVALVLRACIGLIRKLLSPMMAGTPFSNTHIYLRGLARYALILGILTNLSEGINLLIVNNVYNLSELFMSEKFTSVAIHYETDFSFIAVWAVLLLLSYVFRYGQELQNLSDETL